MFKFYRILSLAFVSLSLSSCQLLDSTDKRTYFSRTYSVYKEHLTVDSVSSNLSIADSSLDNSFNAFSFERDETYNIGDFPIDNYLKIGKVDSVSNAKDREKYKDYTYFNFHFSEEDNPYSSRLEVHLAYKNGSYEDYNFSYYLKNDSIHMINGENERIGRYGYFLKGNDRVSIIPIDVKIDSSYKTIMLWVKNGIFGDPID